MVSLCALSVSVFVRLALFSFPPLPSRSNPLSYPDVLCTLLVAWLCAKRLSHLLLKRKRCDGKRRYKHRGGPGTYVAEQFLGDGSEGNERGTYVGAMRTADKDRSPDSKQLAQAESSQLLTKKVFDRAALRQFPPWVQRVHVRTISSPCTSGLFGVSTCCSNIKVSSLANRLLTQFLTVLATFTCCILVMYFYQTSGTEGVDASKNFVLRTDQPFGAVVL